jgi:hypothetical protein
VKDGQDTIDHGRGKWVRIVLKMKWFPRGYVHSSFDERGAVV